MIYQALYQCLCYWIFHARVNNREGVSMQLRLLKMIGIGINDTLRQGQEHRSMILHTMAALGIGNGFDSRG